MKPKIKIKRAYAEVAAGDGFRVLVDRLWPRGVTKVGLSIDEWAKEVAPSAALRVWFGHQPERWAVFQKKYTKELELNDAVGALIKQLKDHSVVTLIYAAKDEQHTHALTLQKFLNQHL